jgi:hypothetical protein
VNVSVVFKANKCPLCDGYAAGGITYNMYGDRVLTCGWAYRYDLVSHVCPRCNAMLGIDAKRLNMLEEYTPEAATVFKDAYAFSAKFRFKKHTS